MKKNVLGVILGIGLILTVAGDAFAQGRGRGNGGGNGRGNSGGQNVGRGNSNADRNRSNQKRNDDSYDRGNGNRRNDDRMSRNSGGRNNRFKGLSRKTGMSAESLRDWYESERASNPGLTYGQFVAANMIARNRGNLSAQDILDGLRDGDSIGQVLRDHRWDDKQIKKERKRIKSRMSDDDDDIYDDRDSDWDF